MPRLVRRPRAAQLLSVAEHFGERFQQFFIVSLGDAILIIGLAMSRTGFTAVHLAGFGVTLGSTVLLWRIYVHCAGQVLPAAIGAPRRPARFSQSSPYNHVVMVAGVAATAAGFELAIVGPTGEPTTGWVATILGGPALFLAGRPSSSTRSSVASPRYAPPRSSYSSRPCRACCGCLRSAGTGRGRPGAGRSRGHGRSARPQALRRGDRVGRLNRAPGPHAPARAGIGPDTPKAGPGWDPAFGFLC
ncbi:low temperature requirement protein A [Plantactinospora sp. KLBMP9567]|uniref:low temperature requirement protein A n=1 Tax=Plantactinospora sp. KLBMP9567 TaxID=3085900 RepID=UPI002980CC69|nr:low temperature requirement protein A [Plantactinospora sp. KLBMP9567]MDW5325710.1 low temperature requirement protein A [Plantactinospora sp. KLBMP9567]